MSRVRTTVVPVTAALLLIGCGDSLKSKEKVQAAIVERLQTKTGLDLNALDVSTTSVTFNKNLAYATVAIHPKADPNVTHGMAMNYTLEERDGKWVVLNAGGPKLGGRASGGGDKSGLPPGHPSVAPDQQLLPGDQATPDRSPMAMPGAAAPGTVAGKPVHKGPTQ